MRVLGIIPAREGSKRLPGKNTRLLAGKPMIEWTFEAASAAGLSHIVITTDDPNICDLYHGRCQVIKRPENLASDGADMLPVLEHVLTKVDDYDWVVLLQPTSPCRTSEHIEEAVDLAICTEYGIVSVVEQYGGYDRNGGIYVMRPDALMEFGLAYVMDEDSSIDVNIDSDFRAAARVLHERQEATC